MEFWTFLIYPDPPHWEHVVVFLVALPVPSQTGQLSVWVTSISFCTPKTASFKSNLDAHQHVVTVTWSCVSAAAASAEEGIENVAESGEVGVESCTACSRITAFGCVGEVFVT
jgi:hypothetical protein